MADYETIRKRLGIQLAVNADKLQRRIRKLKTEDVLTVYEEASNMYFSGSTLDSRVLGANLLSAAVHVLEERYEAIQDLDLRQPFPLRAWMNGIPQEEPTRREEEAC